MNRSFLLVLLSAIIFSISLNAQNLDSTNASSKNFQNSFFIELGGAARMGSINYERSLSRRDATYKAFLRAGFGAFRRGIEIAGVGETHTIPVVPVELSIANTISKHSINIGIGLAPTWDKQPYFSFYYGGGTIDEFYMTYFARIGYRLQGARGLLLKVAFVPLLAKEFEAFSNSIPLSYSRKIVPWAGLSIGKSF